MNAIRLIKNALTRIGIKFCIIVLDILGLRPWLVWDMDGCLANIYESEDYMDKLNEIGFFLKTNAYYQTIEAIKMFCEKHPIYGLAICSKPMPNAWCRVEKDGWLNTYLPEVKIRMFVPPDENKSKYIKDTLSSKRIFFFDDYSHNLFEMEESGVCYKIIKVKNQINCKKGTWKGIILDTNDVSPLQIMKDIEEITKPH